MSTNQQSLRRKLTKARQQLLDAQARVAELETALNDEPPATVHALASQPAYLPILDNLIEGCQIIGHDWRYLYINNTTAEQAHQPKEELIGYTMMERYPGIENTPMF